MIKAVWFDVGGTLHTQQATPETDVSYAEEVFSFLAAHGIKTAPTPMALLEHINTGAKAYKRSIEQSLIELPTDEIWQKYILGDFDIPSRQIEGLGEALSYMYDRRRKRITPREGQAETLARLAASGYRMGIISNIMSQTFVPRILDEYGISHYFEHLILSSTCGIRKPKRELFDMAIEKMGILAEEAAYVGDTVSRDVRGTRNAGWRLMIQIDNPLIYHKDTEFRSEATADCHIKRLEEIPNILDAHNAKA